jgi:hypothetical protein
VTYLVDVRFFFWGGGGDEKSKKSVTPKIRKFRFNWGSQRDAIQHETENHTALQTGTGDFVKIPKIGAIHKKTLPRSSPSHDTFTKREERHRNGNLSLESGLYEICISNSFDMTIKLFGTLTN